MANGKTFAENGSRVLIRTSLPNVTAADGAELVHWNTKPDGSGTAYGAYADISLRGRTEPLVLYAQWLQKGEIKVTIDMGRAAAPRAPSPERAMNCRRSFRARKTAPSTTGARITGRRTANARIWMSSTTQMGTGT